MSYYVYVIELDKEVLQLRKFRQLNPTVNPRLPCFYVGQSIHDPITRFKQHRTGYKANRFVQKYGIRLASGIYGKYNPIKTREEAKRIEQHLSETLRAKGHGVWSH